MKGFWQMYRMQQDIRHLRKLQSLRDDAELNTLMWSKKQEFLARDLKTYIDSTCSYLQASKQAETQP